MSCVYVVAIGYDVDVDMMSHLATAFIKLFFREIPKPLIAFDLYQPILQISSK